MVPWKSGLQTFDCKSDALIICHQATHVHMYCYICLVYVQQGYKQRDAFIMTQAPLPDTVVDFWTMIYDHSCRAIVMLNELDVTDLV